VFALVIMDSKAVKTEVVCSRDHGLEGSEVVVGELRYVTEVTVLSPS
jgi:hypothetical protein